MARYTGLVGAMVRAQRDAKRREQARVRAAAKAARELEGTRARLAREATKARNASAQAQKQLEREQARLHMEARQHEVELEKQQLQERVQQLAVLLSTVVGRDTYLDLDTLRPELVLPDFDPAGLDRPEPEPKPEDYLPRAPSVLANMWPGATAKYQEALRIASERYAAERSAHADREAARLRGLTEVRDRYHRDVLGIEEQYETQNTAIDQLKQDFTAGQSRAVAEYFRAVLEASEYPEDFPRAVKVAYVPDSKQLVVEKDLPALDAIPEVEAYRYVKARDEIATVSRAAAQRKTLYASALAQTTLRTLYEVFCADRPCHIDSVVLNSYVGAIDPGSGLLVRPCLVTVRTTRAAFSRLNLAQVEPLACLRALNAGVSRSPAELSPVRPVLEFSMVDPRFIDEADVLSTLDQRPNLIELTPGEFESLITNLFEKMGLETRLTQASRDGGVDCVAYDPRPIFGGKVIIQAKRYKHTVGVSAVRDLFGTLQNEGASKGILVTTSGYGKAAFDFANGKPLELLSGEHLLYLLKENAGLEAKIEAPPAWRDPEPDAPDT